MTITVMINIMNSNNDDDDDDDDDDVDDNNNNNEFQIVGVANENDLQPYFFNFADGIVRSLLEADLKLLDGL